jgi:endonuclease III related protein
VQQMVDAAFALDPPEFRLPLLNEFHALVVSVGKHHCGPQPHCESCPLALFK